jgi:hypothetical protein
VGVGGVEGAQHAVDHHCQLDFVPSLPGLGSIPLQHFRPCDTIELGIEEPLLDELPDLLQQLEALLPGAVRREYLLCTTR